MNCRCWSPALLKAALPDRTIHTRGPPTFTRITPAAACQSSGVEQLKFSVQSSQASVKPYLSSPEIVLRRFGSLAAQQPQPRKGFCGHCLEATSVVVESTLEANCPHRLHVNLSRHFGKCVWDWGWRPNPESSEF